MRKCMSNENWSLPLTNKSDRERKKEDRVRERERERVRMPAVKETEICKQKAPRLRHALRTFLCNEVFGTRAKHIIWSSHF